MQVPSPYGEPLAARPAGGDRPAEQLIMVVPEDVPLRIAGRCASSDRLLRGERTELWRYAFTRSAADAVDLLKHAEVVTHRPMFDDQSVLDAKYVQLWPADLRAGHFAVG